MFENTSHTFAQWFVSIYCTVSRDESLSAERLGGIIQSVLRSVQLMPDKIRPTLTSPREWSINIVKSWYISMLAECIPNSQRSCRTTELQANYSYRMHVTVLNEQTSTIKRYSETRQFKSLARDAKPMFCRVSNEYNVQPLPETLPVWQST